MKRFLSFVICIMLLLCFSSCLHKSQRSLSFQFKEGNQYFELGKYNIFKQDLAELINVIKTYSNLPDKLNLKILEININKNGDINSFNIILTGYNQDNNPVGQYDFKYNDKTMSYDFYPNNDEFNVNEYNPNTDIEFLNSEFKRIPFEQQIAFLNTNNYCIYFSGISKIQEGISTIDGRNSKNFPTLTLEEYNSFIGGVGDGKHAICFKLGDETSSEAGENLIRYICNSKDQDTLINKNEYSQKTFKILNNLLLFSYDYSQSWFKCDLAKYDFEKMINFYGDSIPSTSYYLSSTINAFIYSWEPAIYLSNNNGQNWKKINLLTNEQQIVDSNSFSNDPMIVDNILSGLGNSLRKVEFLNDNEGYVAIGTDWSMGNGGFKALFTTNDSGNSWNKYNLPGEDNQLLTGISFADIKHAVVSVQAQSDEKPSFYYTKDGGKTWENINLQFGDEIPEKYMFSYVSSFELNNSDFVLKIKQDSKPEAEFIFYSNKNNLTKWTKKSS